MSRFLEKLSDNMPGFWVRLGESILTIVVSSVPIYMFTVSGKISSNNATYFIVFMVSALVFFILNFRQLSNYIMVVEDNLPYLLTNLALFVLQLALCMLAINLFEDTIYTVFFGFTKPLRAFGMDRVPAALIFYGVYLLEILYFPIEKAIYYRRG